MGSNDKPVIDSAGSAPAGSFSGIRHSIEPACPPYIIRSVADESRPFFGLDTRHLKAQPCFPRVRKIIRTFGLRVPVIKLSEHKEKRYYVIQLPDKSNTLIPIHWAD